MMDARRLTKELGKNPDAWSDVKEVLPLLQQSRWHRKVRYGYARGGREARNYVNNVRQYYQSLLWLDNEQQKAHRRKELDEDDSSEPDVPAQRPAIIAEVVKHESSPPSLAGGCVLGPVLCSHDPLGIRGALERTIAMYSLRCSSCEGPFFGPTQDQGGGTGCEHAEEPCWPEKPNVPGARDASSAGRHETQDLAQKPLLHAADSGAHQYKPGISRVFYSLVRLRFKQNGAFGDQGVAVVAKIIHRAASPKPLQLLPAGRTQAPDAITGLNIGQHVVSRLRLSSSP